ncbi:uncharacterized protein LOC116225756 isoform X2 [Phasianus colchicus]|uniref:uncharacterized protein LOC116225756 isoform X2 n=1 Tax=Phasianus colchicus TaxID=9054 RepID=UPI00129ED69D|nr:uncharacterized protein LOC116225756 isoform X2 [Phasianus colchicus]
MLSCRDHAGSSITPPLFSLPGKPGKYCETNMSTTNLCNNVCSSKCAGSTGCGQECQQGEGSHPPSSPTGPTKPVLCCLEGDLDPVSHPGTRMGCSGLDRSDHCLLPECIMRKSCCRAPAPHLSYPSVPLVQGLVVPPALHLIDRTGMGTGRGCWGPDPLSPPAKEDFRPWIDTDPTTNCMNKCTVESNCRGSGKCCRIGCLFRCLQLVPARLDTHPKKKVPHIIGCCNSTCSSDTNGPSHLPYCSPLRRSSNFGVSLFLLGLGCRWFSDPRELCYLAPEHGLCKRHIYCYAYIPASRSCRLLVFSGCRGNANSLEKCQQVCEYGLDKR